MRDITLIVARGHGGVIGDGHSMPWHLPEDLKWFKQVTMGAPLVMGRATYDSIGRPLPGRRTIVVTRDRGWHADGVEVAHGIPEALEIAGDVPEVFVAGGGQVYAACMPLATRLVITEVDLKAAGPVVFPEVDESLWREVWREEHDGWTWRDLRRSTAQESARRTTRSGMS